MIEEQLNKVNILLIQGKYNEAEKILTNLMASDPDEVLVMVYYAEVLRKKGSFKEALDLINSCIQKEPNNDHWYYRKSMILLEMDNYNSAKKAIKTAIEIDPNESDYHSTLSAIHLNKKLYEVALLDANKALELDSQNTMALNIRSTVLLKLNRTKDSQETIQGALSDDPNNPFTHANYGWNLLETGNHIKALDHFKEALSIDPNLDIAQQGMAEALKARYFIYKLFLKYSFWMGNQMAKYQWKIIIGIYIGFKVLKTIAKNNEVLQPFMYPILGLIGFAVLSTWFIEPLSNLFLRLNKYGKHLLGKDELLSSTFVGISAGLIIISIILFFVTQINTFILLGVYGLLMMIPLGSMLSPENAKSKKVIITSILAIVGIIGLIQLHMTFNNDKPDVMFFGIFLFGIFGYSWYANYTSIRE